MNRVLLFIPTSLAIVPVLPVSMRVPGVEPYLNAQGLNLNALLIFAAVMGFGISGGRARGFKQLFITHPPLEEHIVALKAQGRH